MEESKKTKAQLIKENKQLHEKLRIAEEANSTCQMDLSASHKNQQMLQGLFDNSPIPIQFLDKEGFSISENKAHKKLFEATPPEKHSFFEDKQFKDQSIDRKFKLLKAGKVISIESSTYNAIEVDPKFPDKPLWIRSVGFPIFDKFGVPESYVLMLEDFTQRKHAEQQNEELNRQLKQLTEYLQKVRENERQHLADEMHDAFSTPLSIIERRLKDIRDNNTDEESLAEIENMIGQIQNSRDLIRKLIAEMGSDLLKDLGIVSAIKNYIAVFSKRNNIIVQLHSKDPIHVNPDVANMIYRIMLESLNNVACHARATEVSIILKKKADKLFCSIADNGIGIPQQAIDSNQTYGLLSMKHRCENLGGTFAINNNNLGGTSIELSVPITSDFLI
ncbi:MAG: ATP-binding protein [Bacteroidota bacterium]